MFISTGADWPKHFKYILYRSRPWWSSATELALHFIDAIDSREIAGRQGEVGSPGLASTKKCTTRGDTSESGYVELKKVWSIARQTDVAKANWGRPGVTLDWGAGGCSSAAVRGSALVVPARFPGSKNFLFGLGSLVETTYLTVKWVECGVKLLE